MEAVPRLPMLSFELKTSPESTEYASKLKKYINEFYNEDGESYQQEIKELETLRFAAVHVSRDYTGCSTLKRYFCQLHLLQKRFPMTDDGVACVSFMWSDIYSGLVFNISDIKYEQACILYNIGALHSDLGAMDSRQTSDGMKISCTHFQCAAWAFQHLRDNFPQPKGSDMSYDLLTFFINIMLAQAQECILEKSMLDNRKSTIIAKVAAQIADYYKQAQKIMEIGSKSSESGCISEIVGSKLYKSWQRYLQFKLLYHSCIAFMYMGNQAEEQQKMGERLGYLQAAIDKLNEAIKLSKHMEKENLTETLTFTMDVVGGKYEAAKKENDFIYHEKVPAIDSLAEIKGASLVKGIPFHPSDPEVSGADIFARLVPMEMHEASSLYSEEKAKILRHVGANIDEKNQELEMYLASLQLDNLKLSGDNEKLPQELIECCAALSVKPNVVKDLIDAMQNLSSVYHDVESSLKEIEALLNEDDVKEKEFKELMGQRGPSMIILELKKECSKYVEAHKKASESNNTLHKAMNLHVANLRLLASPIEEIDKAIPKFGILDTPIDEGVVRQLHHLLAKVDEMKIQRHRFENQLREQIQSDDITKQLVAQDEKNIQELFQKELKKHEQLVSLLEQNLAAQDNVLRALTDANAKYADIRKTTNQLVYKRETMIRSLINSYEAYEDLLAKSQKGQEFYRKLEANVNKLVQRTRGVCKVQEEERQQLLDKANKKICRPKPTSTPSSTPTPKLKDFLPYMQTNISRVQVVPREAASSIPAPSSSKDGAPSSSSQRYCQYPMTIDSMYLPRPAPVGSEQTDTPIVKDYVGSNSTAPSKIAPTGYDSSAYYSPLTPASVPNYLPSAATYPPQQNVVPTSQQSFIPPRSQQSFIPPPSQQSFIPPPSQQSFIPPPSSQQSFIPPSSQQSFIPPPSQQSFIAPPSQQSFIAPPLQQSFIPSSQQSFAPPSQHTFIPSSQQNLIGTSSNYPYVAVSPHYQQMYEYEQTLAAKPEMESYPHLFYASQQQDPTQSRLASNLADSTTGTTSYANPVAEYSNFVPQHYLASNTAPSSNVGSYVGSYIGSDGVNVSGVSYGMVGNESSLQYTQAGVGHAQTTSSGGFVQYPLNGSLSGAQLPPASIPASTSAMTTSYPYAYPSSGVGGHQEPMQNYQQPVSSKANISTKEESGRSDGSRLSSGNENFYYYQPIYNSSIPPTSYQSNSNPAMADLPPKQLPPAMEPMKPRAQSQGPTQSQIEPQIQQQIQQEIEAQSEARPPLRAQTQVATSWNQAQSPSKTGSNLQLLEELKLQVDCCATNQKEEREELDKPATRSVGDVNLNEGSRRNCGVDADKNLSLAKDPYSETDVLNRFVSEVERFEKLTEGLTKQLLNGPTLLEQKWKEIVDSQDRESRKLSISVARCYTLKNRLADVMPYDSNRIQLTTSKDDYINASLLKELSQSPTQFIATQCPLATTYVDFWQMVYEQQSEIVVCLMSDAEIKTNVYWPQEKSQILNYGLFAIGLQSSKSKSWGVERILTITHQQSRITKVVFHLQCTMWPPSENPGNLRNFLDLVGDVQSFHQQQRSLSRPIVVHCNAGVGRTGVFCMVLAAVQDVSAGRGLVDVTAVASRMTLMRKFIFQDKEQLRFVYEAILYHAWDILMKRGILSSKTSFEEKLPTTSKSSHTRHPSQDFILGSLQTAKDADKGSDKNSDKAIEAEPEVAGGERSRSDSLASISSLSSCGSSARSNLPANLANLDVTNFSLDPLPPKSKRKITRDSFLNPPGAGLSEAKSDLTDPLCQLDPMWTLKKNST